MTLNQFCKIMPSLKPSYYWQSCFCPELAYISHFIQQQRIYMRRLFIVDDDYDILLSLGMWFKKMGFAVDTFENSRTMFSALHQSVPDLILLDINLQGEDGREVCKQIKKEDTHACPVILFSANYPALEGAQNLYADGILHKPFDLQEALQMVKSHIHSNGGGMA